MSEVIGEVGTVGVEPDAHDQVVMTADELGDLLGTAKPSKMEALRDRVYVLGEIADALKTVSEIPDATDEVAAAKAQLVAGLAQAAKSASKQTRQRRKSAQ